jgi:hypothetical protein
MSARRRGEGTRSVLDLIKQGVRMDHLSISDLEDWFRATKPGNRRVYYRYKLGSGQSIAIHRMPGWNADIRATADFAWSLYLGGRAILVQKIVDGYCEYLIQKKK